MYQWIFDHVITHSDPETAHETVIKACELAGTNPVTLELTSALFDRSDTSLPPHSTFLPRRLKGRLGMAAGFDKNAVAIKALCALGFGFVEIGTVTPRPQPGNPRPRLWRMPQSREVRNKMGFNNDGVDQIAQRLKQLRSTRDGRSLVVGANIGKNKITPNEEAPRDYELCAMTLAPLVDFLVINVSSPNTPGLRDLQSVQTLRPIASATAKAAYAAARRRVPVFVKIAPDLADEDVRAAAEMVNELDLAGVVAANTTINHDLGVGGVSGPRLKDRTLAIIRLLRQQLDEGRTIIGVGGISSIEDALDYVEAGADLLEALTAFIYHGPAWPGRINRALSDL